MLAILVLVAVVCLCCTLKRLSELHEINTVGRRVHLQALALANACLGYMFMD